MSPQRRILTLICIMAAVTIMVEVVAIGILYRTAISEERARLVETAVSQARLIEAIARFDVVYSNNYPEGPQTATLSQIVDAHNHYRGFGETGEFTLSKREGDNIVFLLTHRHSDMKNPKPVLWESNLAEPMRLALSGRSGTVIGLDYRGARVLAAFEPVNELNLGIVAKIDLAEVRAPFMKAILLSGVIGIFCIVAGAAFFVRISNPILRKLTQTVESLQNALNKVKLLSGLLPICSNCKKIRDDKGYWNQIESYIRDHSEAEFSHSFCPECVQTLYPDLSLGKKKKRKRNVTNPQNNT